MRKEKKGKKREVFSISFNASNSGFFLSVSVSFSLSLSLSVSDSVSVSLTLCLAVCVSLCLFVSVSFCLSVRLSVSLYIKNNNKIILFIFFVLLLVPFSPFAVHCLPLFTSYSLSACVRVFPHLIVLHSHSAVGRHFDDCTSYVLLCPRAASPLLLALLHVVTLCCMSLPFAVLLFATPSLLPPPPPPPLSGSALRPLSSFPISVFGS